MATIDNLYNDKKNAALTSALTLTIIFLLLIFITIDRNNPPIQMMEVAAEIPVEILDETPKIKGDNGGGGGGTPSNDDVNPIPKPQTSSILTNTHGEESVESKGKSNKTTATNSNNTSTSTQKSDNPFATDGGSGTGKGGGKGSGNGLGIGKDNGPGTGAGDGGTADRVRIKDPNVENIISDVNLTIYLKVKIDENGNVTSAFSTVKSTTTNPQIINKVIAATIAQTRYNKKPGARIEDGFITVKIRAR